MFTVRIKVPQPIGFPVSISMCKPQTYCLLESVSRDFIRLFTDFTSIVRPLSLKHIPDGKLALDQLPNVINRYLLLVLPKQSRSHDGTIKCYGNNNEYKEEMVLLMKYES